MAHSIWGAATGLLVSKDKGASWQPQGAVVNIWQGPFFGSNEKEMVVVGKDGVFMTQNSGETWTRSTGLKPKEGNYEFSPNWFGCYAWDPIEQNPLRVGHGKSVSTKSNPPMKCRLET